MRNSTSAMLLSLPAGSGAAAGPADPMSLFDGHTLAGWDVQEESLWRLGDGAIDGDFELTLKIRIKGSDFVLRQRQNNNETPVDWSVNPVWHAEYKSLPEHPVTQGVQPFDTADEWYFHMRFSPEGGTLLPILTDLPTVEEAGR
jgi:hypothetical protein